MKGRSDEDISIPARRGVDTFDEEEGIIKYDPKGNNRLSLGSNN